MYSVPSGGIVRAKTHCDILLLSKADIQQVLQHFPGSKSTIFKKRTELCTSFTLSTSLLWWRQRRRPGPLHREL